MKVQPQFTLGAIMASIKKTPYCAVQIDFMLFV